MITAKEAREIPVKVREKPVYDLRKNCDSYIREAAEEGLTEVEVFEMTDDVEAELITLGYKVELTNIPNDPRMVSGWTIHW